MYAHHAHHMNISSGVQMFQTFSRYVVLIYANLLIKVYFIYITIFKFKYIYFSFRCPRTNWYDSQSQPVQLAGQRRDQKVREDACGEKGGPCKGHGLRDDCYFGAVSDLVRRRSRETMRNAHGGERSSRPESSFDA